MPLSVRSRVLFGGAANQIGWFLLGFGLIFVWAFIPAADLAGIFVFRGELARADGAVVRCEKTNFSEGGDEHNDGTPVFAIHYAFEDAGGFRREGVSYGTGVQYPIGEKLLIEYVDGDPQHSRVMGLRSAPFAAWVLFVAVFPFIGMLFLAGGLRRSLRGDRLLRVGKLAFGKFMSSRATNTQINDRRVYELTFEFTSDDGMSHTIKTRTHLPEKLRDDEAEPLLYDPACPERAVMFDSLPGSPRIDEFGALAPALTGSTLGTLAAPLLTIVGHGTFLLVKLSESG